ncbi:hypothetical protein B296_00026581 [Ensete ventricosum]|uniref:Uncharacterized protein n=1 Tax=Ensete ventricosum TaxID=4639 RepID=A0A427ARF9_ENSVE|nr:hypothetical protein B296_00026581 [Ensete ventricosum]
MMADTLRLAINCDSSSASFSSQLMATCEAASQVDQLPHSASIVFDAGEPTSASQVDPEAQLPPPPTDDDPPATFLEKVVQQLSLSVGMVASVGPTARNHDDELAFKLYHLVVFTIYGFDIHHLQTMGPVRQAATPANSRRAMVLVSWESIKVDKARDGEVVVVHEQSMGAAQVPWQLQLVVGGECPDVSTGEMNYPPQYVTKNRCAESTNNARMDG